MLLIKRQRTLHRRRLLLSMRLGVGLGRESLLGLWVKLPRGVLLVDIIVRVRKLGGLVLSWLFTLVFLCIILRIAARSILRLVVMAMLRVAFTVSVWRTRRLR